VETLVVVFLNYPETSLNPIPQFNEKVYPTKKPAQRLEIMWEVFNVSVCVILLVR
jgi:hypothetical protein